MQCCNAHFIVDYSNTVESQFLEPLIFCNSLITQTKSCFPSLVKHYIFTLDFSNSPISRTNFNFPWRFEKSGFHCKWSCQCKKFHTCSKKTWWRGGLDPLNLPPGSATCQAKRPVELQAYAICYTIDTSHVWVTIQTKRYTQLSFVNLSVGGAVA